ncbi:hypothetical protein PGT21_030598 [Puccinia graminis f. sp. tritici]|uniref:Uncharacterized protein n=1 Tax=Puccinia graminis f. sp. tritici TaxID=56615 RepID=A0A5B0MYV8_PUCGR|nr:hypothetical protein PGT21_030598 [Puccinia graminis f. sp. tritici]
MANTTSTLPTPNQPARPLCLPPATSIPTVLSPCLETLKSIIAYLHGTNGTDQLEPGLWQSQVIRVTDRAIHLLHAISEQLVDGGLGILDNQDEKYQRVLRLKSVLSDIEVFVGSLTTLQDPLTTILLDPVHFSCTETAVTKLNNRLASLAECYEDVVSLPTRLEQWKAEDAEDKIEDLRALPSYILKSRPTIAVLKKFEAACALPIDAESSDSGPEKRRTRFYDSPLSTTSTHAQTSFPSVSEGTNLSPAQHLEFLNFVYHQNPKLLANHEITNNPGTIQNKDPKVDHLKVCGEYPIDLGDHMEGSSEVKLTRKQKRNRNNNKRKEKTRMNQLRQIVPTSEYSIHYRRATLQPMRLVQHNEVIMINKKLGGIVRFTQRWASYANRSVV